MKVNFLIIWSFLFLAFSATGVSAQNSQPTDENINFGYSKNPPAKTAPKPEKSPADTSAGNVVPPTVTNISTAVVNPDTSPANEVPARFESVAQKTREIAREESQKALRPTEIYKIGSGDVLLITLQESKSNYYTVLDDGSIDYPLAGGLTPVSGLTVEGIERLLRERVQLYENPEISVRVREHASHAIDVLGLVGRAGKQYLQREAIPLYVIRAQAVAESTADQVVIKRAGTDQIVVKMGTAEFDETLVMPGDVVEFVSSLTRVSASGFIYVSGGVNNIGRIQLLDGMTLTQAIIAAGGLSVGDAKKAIVRRKNEAGYLESNTYKIADIKKGKTIDPVLLAGDLIEVGD